MSPETNHAGRNFVGIVLSPGEFMTWSTLPKDDRTTILNGRFEQIDRMIAQATCVQPQEQKKIPQKPGEPDWEQVTRDAQKEFGRKMNDPSKAPYYTDH